MSDLNDLSRPVTTDTEPNVLDTLRSHIVRAATWSGWGATGNKVAGIMSGVTAAVTGGRSLRLYRRNDANTADEEVISLPGISVGGNAATASAAQTGSALRSELDGVSVALGNRVVKTSSNRPGVTNLYTSDSDLGYFIRADWESDKAGYWSMRGFSGATTYHAPVSVGYAVTAGNAGTVTTVTAAQVGTATAGLAAGGVGAYVFARRNNVDISFGGICSGGTLFPTGAIYAYQFGSFGSLGLGSSISPLSGSWMCMGSYIYRASNGSVEIEGATLWLRIA